MLPIVLTKPQKVLIVGAGRACEIKLKSLTSFLECDITIVSLDFPKKFDSDYKKVYKDFYSLSYEFFTPFDLIYIAIELQDTTMVKKLAQTKLINILSNPSLSNFRHPCTREKNNTLISVTNIDKPNPKKACNLVQKFISII